MNTRSTYCAYMLGGSLALLALFFYAFGPDLRRYIKIERM